MLEVTYECLENGNHVNAVLHVRTADIGEGGIPLDRVAGSETSCYVGCSSKGATTCFYLLNSILKHPPLFRRDKFTCRNATVV